jgi:hypothetical protein
MLRLTVVVGYDQFVIQNGLDRPLNLQAQEPTVS